MQCVNKYDAGVRQLCRGLTLHYLLLFLCSTLFTVFVFVSTSFPDSCFSVFFIIFDFICAWFLIFLFHFYDVSSVENSFSSFNLTACLSVFRCKSRNVPYRMVTLVCFDSAGGSIIPTRTSTSFLHIESHLALRHAVLADSRYLPLASWPGWKDLSRNLNPSLVLHLHAVHLGKHAKDIGHPASVWCVD